MKKILLLAMFFATAFLTQMKWGSGLNEHTIAINQVVFMKKSVPEVEEYYSKPYGHRVRGLASVTTAAKSN